MAKVSTMDIQSIRQSINQSTKHNTCLKVNADLRFDAPPREVSPRQPFMESAGHGISLDPPILAFVDGVQ